MMSYKDNTVSTRECYLIIYALKLNINKLIYINIYYIYIYIYYLTYLLYKKTIITNNYFIFKLLTCEWVHSTYFTLINYYNANLYIYMCVCVCVFYMIISILFNVSGFLQ